MRPFRHDLGTATAVGTALVLPLVMLEWRAYGTVEAGPGVLLTVLWALPVTFVLVLLRPLRDMRRERPSWGHPAGTVLWVGAILVLAAVWVGVLADQMPCFLGIPNCD